MKPQSRTLSGWGCSSREDCAVYRPESWSTARKLVTSHESTLIARGMGRSYGDSATNHGQSVMDCTRLNRCLKFDDTTGVLECEAGTSLAEVIDIFLPRGWSLPTTPGTKLVTIGGAIASDVHGKNHHHGGSFGSYVRSFKLLVADGRVLNCSAFENRELFIATLGGMGLTGIVLSAEIQLKQVESAYVDVLYRRTRDLDHTLEVFGREDDNFEHSVAWIDCLAQGSKLGRSVVMLGRDCAQAALPSALRDKPLQLPTKPQKGVPFNFPSFALNPLSVRAFNECYYWAHGDGQQVVDLNTFFYPLDSVQNWNRIYGKRGFAQYQALFPPETSRQGLIELLEKITQSKLGSFLAVLKSSGPAGLGPMSFLHPGHTLALDFPLSPRVPGLFRQLDEIVLRHRGRLYLAKDSQTSAEVIRTMYPRLPELQSLKAAIDPQGRFASTQARRLGLLPSVAASETRERKAA